MVAVTGLEQTAGDREARTGGCRSPGLQDQAALLFRLRFPLVGQQFPEPVGRVAHDVLEEVVEVFPGIDVTILTGFDEAHE